MLDHAHPHGDAGGSRGSMPFTRLLSAALLLACASACVSPERPPAPSGTDRPKAPGANTVCGSWLDELASDALAPRLTEARAWARAGDFEGALDVLDEAAEELPAEPALNAARAEVLTAMGFPRAAELELERALVLAPDDGRLWMRLALVQSRLGLATKAEEAMQRARVLAKR